MNDDMMDHLSEVEQEVRLVRARVKRLEAALHGAVNDLEYYAYGDARLMPIKRRLREALDGG